MGQGALRGAVTGAVGGAVLGAGGFLIGAQGLALAGTAHTLAEIGLAASSGALSGGVDARMQGGHFSQGLLPGAVGGLLGYGAGRAIGAVAQRWGLPTPEPGGVGQQVGLMQSFRQWAARAGAGAALSEDTIPVGNRLLAPRGAINAPVKFTKPGETFIRVSTNPQGLNFSFRSPGGAQAGTYAFPEDQFLKFQNNPLTIKYFGDLPGAQPTIYGRITPPSGTPIQRGIVPGGQFGGSGGAQEVYFPDEF